MSLPDNVRRLVEGVADRNPADIEAAVEEAVLAVRGLPEYPELVDGLVRHSVQQAVYDARHVSNVRIKRQSGYYGKEAKVVSGASESVREVYKSVYLYSIGATTLGRLRGEELPALAESERSVARGHEFNAELCAKLAGMVPKDRTVEETVPEKKLAALFDRLKRRFAEAA
jgi:hypothetical protein